MDDSDIISIRDRVEAKLPRITPKADEPEETIAPGNAFAVARGTRLPPTLRFLRRNGKRFAIPYGNMPIIWGESSGLVLIEYPHIGTAILGGIDLEIMESRLCEYRVTWIRECTEAQAATLPVAVTRIEWMQRYPSREENDRAFDADAIPGYGSSHVTP